MTATMMNKDVMMAELFSNKDFQERFNEIETIEDFQGLFAEYGVELTKDEVLEICKQTVDAEKRAASDELHEDDLENVSGGSITLGYIAARLLIVGGCYVCGRLLFKYCF